MKYIGWFFTVFTLSFGLFLLAPEKTLAPGESSAGHTEISSRCLDCHTPFRGEFSSKCVECHDPRQIGTLTTTGEKITRPPGRNSPHPENRQCGLCHGEHNGPSLKDNLIEFRHERLPGEQECSQCHPRPETPLHDKIETGCANCHIASDWKRVTFDHSQAKDCISCHKAPQDTMHISPGACEGCHNTRNWRDASFDHDRFFRFDRRHKAPCSACHPNNNYSQYTCYGCHAHSERGVRGEHREEGIGNFAECTDCHRSGSESEAKRLWRQNRRETGSPYTDYREHDDD